jgi:hypothetical protein
MNYRVISSIFANRFMSEDEIETINRYISNLSVPLEDLKIFADCDAHGYDIDGEECDKESMYYSDDEDSEETMIDNFNWTVVNSTTLKYVNEANDIIDYPLSTLQCLLDNLEENFNILFNGRIICYNINISQNDDNEYKGLCYNISNSKLTYHVNKSIDLTQHWKNCVMYARGETITSFYPSETILNSNSFVNFVQNNTFFTLYDIEDLADFEIFEDTCLYVE